ncbi:hypothetical protein D0863_04178 [Hortaea werneckii]|uniref:Actin-like ATPase domain-containing protein n=1 Tax=Hortaea werneckii TaxID=91943 RepID=A0A3M7E8J5_HORWE|nr:hypothetical protein D0863_04178 [Hortaea werneckii]
MAPYSWTPDVVIGIDFGMTCTGVAWSAAPEWNDPKTLQHWPGIAYHEIRNKVDTAVAYDARNSRLRNWGFACDDENPALEVNRFFKLNLDPGYIDNHTHAPTHSEVKQWYCDYLQSLYSYLMRHFRETMPRFESKNVEFVFSVPTTWKDPRMIAEIQRMVKVAGYGKEENHRASISLTEAEAAAVYASKQQMQKGDVFLVCDAGGGTTDINILKVKSAAKSKTELQPLQCNEGLAIGSTLIDHRIETFIKERLELIRSHIPDDVDSVAKRMVQDRFMGYKCSFGMATIEVPMLPLPIPGLPYGINLPHAEVENSSLILRVEYLQRIFDEQVDKIQKLLDEQFRELHEEHPEEQASYLVLSGGLGSSPYVRDRIRKRYEGGSNGEFPNARSLSIILASEPQLAVVHGLVLARAQALRGGPEIMSTRRCPLSYGVVCRELYDPSKHQGQPVELDKFDKKRYAEGQMSWFLKQGEVVNINEGKSRRFRNKIPPGLERHPWRTQIYMSDMPSHQLPQSIRNKGVSSVCAVEAALDPCDMRLKNHRWYHYRKCYYEAEFSVKMLVGTGLQFEIWGQNGCKSTSHDEIEVQWAPADDPAQQKQLVDETPAMYPIS